MRRLLVLAALLGLTAASSGQIIGHADVDGVESYSQATMDSIGQLKFFFQHASVGENIRVGIQNLHSEDADFYQLVSEAASNFQYPITVYSPPDPTVAGRWYHAFYQSTPKASAFTSTVTNIGWRYPAVDVALMKFCYIDSRTSISEIETQTNDYLSQIAALENEYDQTKFVYVTMPLLVWRPLNDPYFTDPPPNGMSSTDYYNTLERLNHANDMIRSHCTTYGKLLYDLADIEAHDPDGVETTFEWNNKTLQAGYRGYYWAADPTTNNGHLGNPIGRRRVGLGWYAFAAVIAAGQGPVAVNDSYAAQQDTTLNVSAPGVLQNDLGDNLTAVNASTPSHGSVSLSTNGSFTYTPATGYTGPDSFTYQAYDGDDYSAAATVSINVTSTGNTPPVANNDSYSVTENTTLVISAAAGVLDNDTDADSDPLTAVNPSTPSHGSLSLNSDGSFTYTPDADYTGSDSFTYQAYDGEDYSSAATVNITVNAASSGSWSDGDVGDVAAAGSYSLDSGVYTVEGSGADIYNDVDEFYYVYRTMSGDGEIVARVASVEYVSAVSKAGLMMRDSLNANSRNAFICVTPGNGVHYQYRLTDGATTGRARNTELSAPQWLKLVRETNSFTAYYSSDGQAWTQLGSAQTISMGADIYVGMAVTSRSDGTLCTAEFDNVTAPGGSANTAPVATDDYYTNVEDWNLYIDPAGVLENDYDADEDTLTAVLVDEPSHGSVTLNSNGSFDYNPAPNYYGSDSFTYRAYDGQAYSNIATVTIVMDPVNDAPVAVADSGYQVNENDYLVVSAPGVLANDTDVEGDTLTAIKVSDPSHGSVSLASDGSFVYTPDADYYGPDSFTYKANDGYLDSNTVSVSITVIEAAGNTPPVAVADSYSTDQDTVLTVSAVSGVLANDSDADEDPLTAIKVSDPSHGSVSLASDGSFVYTPDSGYTGADSFTYKANDGTDDSNTVAVDITVNAPGGQPQTLYAGGDAYVTSASPDSNYGSTASVQVRYVADAVQRQSYVSFDLSGVGFTIDGATLRLYQNGTASTSVTVNVYAAAGTWAEGTVTWNNQPGTTGNSLGSAAARTTAEGNGWVEFTLTASAIEAMRTGNNYGLVIVPQSGGSTSTITFSAKEHMDGNDPELVVSP